MSDKPVTEYRVEVTGNIKVHHPIRPSVHATAKEVQVMCA